MVVGLLARKAFFRPRVDLRTGLGELPQSLLTPRQFLGDRQAVRDARSIRRLGLRQELGHFSLQLRLDLSRMLVR